MPSRKQRRRQQKLRRHEWEEVLVDEEGNEVVLEADARTAAKEREKPRKGAGAKSARRPVREVQPPSWRRVGKRAAIFAPLMFVMVHLLTGDEVALPGKVLQTLFLLAFFLPFSYAMDTITYRAYRRRLERS